MATFCYATAESPHSGSDRRRFGPGNQISAEGADAVAGRLRHLDEALVVGGGQSLKKEGPCFAGEKLDHGQPAVTCPLVMPPYSGLSAIASGRCCRTTQCFEVARWPTLKEGQRRLIACFLRSQLIYERPRHAGAQARATSNNHGLDAIGDGGHKAAAGSWRTRWGRPRP